MTACPVYLRFLSSGSRPVSPDHSPYSNRLFFCLSLFLSCPLQLSPSTCPRSLCCVVFASPTYLSICLFVYLALRPSLRHPSCFYTSTSFMYQKQILPSSPADSVEPVNARNSSFAQLSLQRSENKVRSQSKPSKEPPILSEHYAQAAHSFTSWFGLC